MKPARHIAPWLAAVIVMIAAVLMPSGARAHGGHAHDARTVPVAATIGVDAELTESRTPRRAVSMTSAGLSVSAVVEPSRLACACPGCQAGAPCGHAPSSCCAAGLVPALVPGLAAPTDTDRARLPDEPRLSGITPDAQAEPPRPIA